MSASNEVLRVLAAKARLRRWRGELRRCVCGAAFTTTRTRRRLCARCFRAGAGPVYSLPAGPARTAWEAP